MSTPALAPLDRSETTFRFLAEPSSVNFGGKVHGGALMKWIDETAYACSALGSQRHRIVSFSRRTPDHESRELRHNPLRGFAHDGHARRLDRLDRDDRLLRSAG